jgi:hypothetical protein
MAAALDMRRELAHRASNGIEVTLFWSKPTNRVTVKVFEACVDRGFELEIDGSKALDAFHHPYAYAARSEVLVLATAPQVFAA